MASKKLLIGIGIGAGVTALLAVIAGEIAYKTLEESVNNKINESMKLGTGFSAYWPEVVEKKQREMGFSSKPFKRTYIKVGDINKDNDMAESFREQENFFDKT